MELPFFGDAVNSCVSVFLSIAASLLVLAFFAASVALIVIYIIDVTQTRQTIRRNYPVVGRFRYFFEHLGEFFDSISFPWIARNYRLTAPCVPGSTAPPWALKKTAAGSTTARASGRRTHSKRSLPGIRSLYESK